MTLRSHCCDEMLEGQVSSFQMSKFCRSLTKQVFFYLKICLSSLSPFQSTQIHNLEYYSREILPRNPGNQETRHLSHLLEHTGRMLDSSDLLKMTAANLSLVVGSKVVVEWRSSCHTWHGDIILSSALSNISGVEIWKLYSGRSSMSILWSWHASHISWRKMRDSACYVCNPSH